MRHILRNALISTLALFGLWIGHRDRFRDPRRRGGAVGGFNLRSRLSVVQGLTVALAVLVSATFLLTDLLQAWLDPRILNPVLPVRLRIEENLRAHIRLDRAGRRRRWRRSVARAAGPGRHSRRGAAARRVSAPVLGRDAAAGDDRDRAGERPARAARRRADDRARHDDPGPDPSRTGWRDVCGQGGGAGAHERLFEDIRATPIRWRSTRRRRRSTRRGGAGRLPRAAGCRAPSTCRRAVSSTPVAHAFDHCRVEPPHLTPRGLGHVAACHLEHLDPDGSCRRTRSRADRRLPFGER